MSGSTTNDAFYLNDGEVATKTNHSGGIQGGMSNGMPLECTIAFKPVATIGKQQATINREREQVVLEAKGRHDPCVVPRAVPIVEAMVSLVLADFMVRQGCWSRQWPPHSL
jgi:chorismate synthase